MEKLLNPPLSQPNQSIRFKLVLKYGGESGFALIATLSVMALVIMIAMAMVSLSSSVVRTSQHGRAMEEAQANARMALVMAIGKLQKEMGQDMRISAPADILDPDNPALIGVWRSWEGSDHEDSSDSLAGRPKAPVYSDKQVAVSSDPNGRFVSWLVSGGSETELPENAATLVQNSSSGDTIPLLSTGSLSPGDGREVHVIPTVVDDTGAYAWWVSGENQKARVPKPYKLKNEDAASWAGHNRSHATADPSVFGLDSVLTDASENIITLNTTELIADPGAATKPHESFHDLSTSSVGLLTNVATGGWRKDLSLLSETWEDQPYKGLELFQISPGNDLTYTRPEPVMTPTGDMPPEHIVPGSVFYPWSDYRDPGTKGERRAVHHRRAPVSSWASMINHATMYKRTDLAVSGMPTIDVQSWKNKNINKKTDDNTFSGLHRTWVVPQMARLQLIVSHYATRDYEVGAPERLRPAVLYTPVITLWNPYSYELRFPKNYFYLRFAKPTPIALQYESITNDYWAVQNSTWLSSSYEGRRMTTNGGFHMRFRGDDLVLKPGETRVFSPAEEELHDETYVGKVNASSLGPAMWMQPGVRYGVGYYYGLDVMMRPDILEDGRDENGETDILTYINNNVDPMDLTHPPGFTLSPQARFNVASMGVKAKFPGDVSGISTEWNINSTSNPDHGLYWAFFRTNQADEMFPPMTDLANATLAECEKTPVPFLSMIYGSQIASQTHIPTKGVLQANPLVRFCASGGRSYYSERYPGMSNMLSSPWAFSFVPHTAGPGGDMLPNADNDNSSGYIVTGFRKADGINRLVMVDLPAKPLTSLAELTDWHIRGHNPVPPHPLNIIANSDASPLIPSDNVVDPTNNLHAGERYNEQQDDSYCANHLLFDDWFCSSIAPEPDTFGPQGKSLKENYLEFLIGSDPLANRAYLPIIADATSSMSIATDVFSEHVEPIDSWKTIASRFEVQGMFNVNSTSVNAWRALLRHARNQKIPYLMDSGAIGLSEETDFAFPRSSVAGQDEAGKSINGNYFANTEFAGYRVFTDKMLNQLAENIVTQVRSRGPFLSLSEFVNRQLSTDEDLAIGGAIQVALNKLSEDALLNPFSVMQSESSPSAGDPPGQDDYMFSKAAEGYSTYGLPGWTRQADILKSLAPILSARDDTFTIRAYGDARDKNNNVIARAWCEAVVRRTKDYIDSSDSADITTQPINMTNQQFGRRFKLTSFRWLNANEV